MSDLENQYIVLNKRIVMYLTKNNYNLSVEQVNDEKSDYNFFGINETGKVIVEEITGMETLAEFEKRICNKLDIDYDENIDWIQKYLLELKGRNILEFKEHPEKSFIWKVIGDKQIISPMHVTVELTDSCNLSCKHCYLSASSKNHNFFDIEKFRTLVKKLKENRVINVELTGGEIFVNPDNYEIIKLALEKFATVGILTNGTILNEDIILLLQQYKKKVILNVSIDSVDPNKHDSFRGVKGAFEKSCNNIKRLAKAGLTVRMASCIFHDNMWEIDKLAALATELGAKVFTYNFIENFGRAKTFTDGKEKIDSEASDKYYKYIQDTIKKYKEIIPIIESENYLSGLKNCGAGTVSIVIGANGNIRPCVLTPKEISLGNVFNEDYKEIFEKDIFSDISSIKPPNTNNGCDKSCKDYYTCRGCYLKALNINSKREKPCDWVVSNNLNNILNWYTRTC
ncbi:radical SAM protein [Clostridium sp. Marseille-Q2269]|uniref:radical SAM protein n=1 Tax=Clostridium sp. Marseille-Q2269 TaxID=2942205 RepID=UPI002072C6AF|nr:radical SAM protein [Clostridium sp. Marseille-Q2269]